ncbi:sulfotransferase 2A2-like [Dermacentor andersoni]|uniref:sulfotransferase 2A2-like n=1 Tax=Dermacentor andersoni TaxID=34620 RepID=UPI003B3AE710
MERVNKAHAAAKSMLDREALEDRHVKQGDQKSRSKKPSLQLVRGTPFATHLLRECIESAMDYGHREGDLFIVTYLKCGTTWMQHIVYLIQSGGVPPANAAQFHGASPYFEVNGSHCVQWTTRPGSIKSHLPLHQTGYSPEARYIIVIRNPFDVVVSLHHFWRMISSYEYDGGFDDSFENFVAGNINSGDYFDFYRAWCQRVNDPNVLFLVYEDMRKDTEAAILKVARFLGHEHEERLLADNGRVLKDVLRYSSFEEMKKYTNKMIHDFYEGEFPFRGEEYKGLRYLHEIIRRGRGSATGDDSACSADKVDYVRKAVVGDWKNYFSPDQTRRLSEKFRRRTRNTPMANLWPELNAGGQEST